MKDFGLGLYLLTWDVYVSKDAWGACAYDDVLQNVGLHTTPPPPSLDLYMTLSNE